MKRLPTDGPVAFERLEARLLLSAGHCIQPDGPMPQAAGQDTAAVEVAGLWDDTDIVHESAETSPDGGSGDDRTPRPPQYDFDFDFDDWVWFGQDVGDGIRKHAGNASPADQAAGDSARFPAAEGVITATRPHFDGVILHFRSRQEYRDIERSSIGQITLETFFNIMLGIFEPILESELLTLWAIARKVESHPAVIGNNGRYLIKKLSQSLLLQPSE